MKLKVILFGILITGSSASFTMQKVNCVLPKRRVLEKRLKESFDDFLEKTTIIEHLAGKELAPTRIVAILDNHVQKYDEKIQVFMPLSVGNKVLSSILQKEIYLSKHKINKGYFLELLLQDNPSALADALSVLEKKYSTEDSE